SDLCSNGYSTNLPCESFMFDLNRYGKKRIVYRSRSDYNLHGGFPWISPQQDVSMGSPITLDTFKSIAEDRMNRWVVQFVKEHGVRQAVGIDGGSSFCDGHVVVDPCEKPREILIPSWMDTGQKLKNVFSGTNIPASRKTDKG